MTKKGIVEKQLEGFGKVLLKIETDKHLKLNEKLTRLIGVQETMFVFIFSMEDTDYRRFRGTFDAVFTRLCAEPESEKAA